MTRLAWEKYWEKLESVGLTLKDDPYSPENDGFCLDMTKLAEDEIRTDFG